MNEKKDVKQIRIEPDDDKSLGLQDGARVAVMGGGPAGSFFSYFLLNMADRIRLKVQIDIYEPRDFFLSGPLGCNMCAGIISESLVQKLAAEGIFLPSPVVERGIDSYTLHMDVGNVNIETRQREKRVGTVFRGSGPRGNTEQGHESFDGFLLAQAMQKGANWIHGRVEAINRVENGVQVKSNVGEAQVYDLLVVASGVNTNALQLFEPLVKGFQPPATVKTYVREYKLGAAAIEKHLSNSIQFFLLDIAGLECAAIVPKGDYVTICLLGHGLDEEIIEAFMNAEEVKRCMPPGWQAEQLVCHCSPRINVAGAIQPYADRLVFIGDAGITRLYKDGIGAAYRAAKAAAATAVFEGIGAEDFRQHYWPTCKALADDNTFGKLIFWVIRQIQHHRIARKAVLRMASTEQRKHTGERGMSSVLWDSFTGSAPYRDIFLRTLRPAFLGQLLWYFVGSPFALSSTKAGGKLQTAMQ